MALFGASISHEDAPHRAVHAALGIQRALGEYGANLERERGLKLQMRIGINTGTVADEFFLRAWDLLNADDFVRWRWQIPLLHARGTLALARKCHEEAWNFAVESLELAHKTNARKHEIRAQLLQGEILTTAGRFNQALPLIQAAVTVAQKIQTRRDIWMGSLLLGTTLLRLGNDSEAEAGFNTSAESIELIATELKTESLIESFLAAPKVREVFRALGRPPTANI
jgi:hypothetical protein